MPDQNQMKKHLMGSGVLPGVSPIQPISPQQMPTADPQFQQFLRQMLGGMLFPFPKATQQAAQAIMPQQQQKKK